MIVAIDGPAGAGKSTIAKLLAARLGFTYIDTGAMYRAATLIAIRFGYKLDDGQSIAAKFHLMDFRFQPPKRSGESQGVFFGDEDITAEIRDPELTKKIRVVCAQPDVRRVLTKLQREMGLYTDSVLEGRDIGTVVFPDADVKFYMDARVEIRARRRLKELAASGHPVPIEQLVDEIKVRDKSDLERNEAPLKQADDAEYIDTSDLNVEEVLDVLEKKVWERMAQKKKVSRKRKPVKSARKKKKG